MTVQAFQDQDRRSAPKRETTRSADHSHTGKTGCAGNSPDTHKAGGQPYWEQTTIHARAPGVGEGQLPIAQKGTTTLPS